MDTKNIWENKEQNEITDKDLAKRLNGFIDKETGWITIPVTKKMISESSHLELVSSKFTMR